MQTAFHRREQRPFTQGAKQRLETKLGLSMWIYSQLAYTFQHPEKGVFEQMQRVCGFAKNASFRTEFFEEFLKRNSRFAKSIEWTYREVCRKR